MKKPLILGRTYFPAAGDNLMSDVGDVAKAREDFLRLRPSNLAFMLEKRFLWMNEYIKEDDKGIEVGCGHGLSRLYIKSRNFLLTDYIENPWVDMKVDALDMPFEDSSMDFIVSSNMIHHLAYPYKFFEECSRVLKKGGLLIIQEINASLIMRAILRKMKHEGWSFDTDVFDRSAVCNDPADPWSANCAIPNLLFDDAEKFERNFSFEIIRHTFSHFLIFPLSGGVIAKKKTINLPRPVLKAVDLLDGALIALSQSVFPMQKEVVLVNTKGDNRR